MSPSKRHQARRLGRLIALISLTATGAPRAARAADRIALERFQPAPAGDRFLGLPSPYVPGELDLHALLLVDYAYKPLVLREPQAGAQTLVTYQIVVHAALSLALAKRVLIDVDVPTVSLQAGSATPALHRADFGDLRLGERTRLYGEDATPFQVGLGGYLWLPSATGSITGDGRARGMPYLSLGGLVGPILWTGLLGAEFRAPQLYRGVVHEGSSLDLGLGLGYLIGARRQLQVGAETTASFLVSQSSSRNFNAELLIHGRYRFLDRFETGVGIGPGLSRGIGTPVLRGVVFLAYVPVAELWAPAPPRPESDEWPTGEGVFDRSTGRAELDAPSSPPGRAADVKPAASSEPALRRRRDARIVGDELVATETGILFDDGSAALSAPAEWEVHAIAEFLILHPEIRKVEIRGHADLHGTVQSNGQLSARRAEAVRRALVRHSVEATRLAVRSYGPNAPLASSTTPEGMRQNRRVVIGILERVAAKNDQK